MTASNNTKDTKNKNNKAKAHKRPKTIEDRSAHGVADIEDVEAYARQRHEILSREGIIGFDHRCTALATDLEIRVNRIIQDLKTRDRLVIYDAAEPHEGYDGQLHGRFPGDHFLSNRTLIVETSIFDIARHMPKGAHLHIHFIVCFFFFVLLDTAKDMDRMFVTSDLPLSKQPGHTNYDRCEIQFSILPPEKENPGDLFAAGYEPRQTMSFQQFRREFPKHFTQVSVDDWLIGKLVFHEEETYGIHQTGRG